MAIASRGNGVNSLRERDIFGRRRGRHGHLLKQETILCQVDDNYLAGGPGNDDCLTAKTRSLGSKAAEWRLFCAAMATIRLGRLPFSRKRKQLFGRKMTIIRQGGLEVAIYQQRKRGNVEAKTISRKTGGDYFAQD